MHCLQFVDVDNAFRSCQLVHVPLEVPQTPDSGLGPGTLCFV